MHRKKDEEKYFSLFFCSFLSNRLLVWYKICWNIAMLYKGKLYTVQIVHTQYIFCVRCTVLVYREQKRKLHLMHETWFGKKEKKLCICANVLHIFIIFHVCYARTLYVYTIITIFRLLLLDVYIKCMFKPTNQKKFIVKANLFSCCCDCSLFRLLMWFFFAVFYSIIRERNCTNTTTHTDTLYIERHLKRQNRP